MIPIDDAPEQQRRHFPLVTLLLVVGNVLVFTYTLSLGSGFNRFLYVWGMTPAEIVRGQDIGPVSPLPIYFTLVTAMFLHTGIIHLAGNMIFLWVFGDNVEDTIGHAGFLAFYLTCGLAASGLQILSDPLSRIPNVGASGAIAGVLAGYLLLFPNASVRTLLFVGPFITITRISALVLIGLWLAFQLVSAIVELSTRPGGTGVALWAHIGGFLAGLSIMAAWKAIHDRPAGIG